MLLNGTGRFGWWIVASLLALGGCSTSDAFDAGANGDLSSGGDPTDGPLGTTATASDTDFDTTDADTSGPGETAEPPNTGSETGEDGVACGLDCGEGGECVPDEQGAPRCMCEDGFADNGATCVACVAPPAGVDLAMSEISLRLTINGVSPPADDSEYGDLFLRSVATGDVVALGDTRSPDLQASVLAGTYDVFYSHVAGSAVVPVNRNARIGTLDAADDVENVIDIPAVVVTGSFSFDAAPAPADPSESGRVWLRDPDTGDEAPLGDTSVGFYSAIVVPGDYQLEYRATAGSGIAPMNPRGTFGTFTAQHSEVPTDIDIPTVQVSGAFSFDGAPAPDDPSESGRILLGRGADVVAVGNTTVGFYSVRLLPGAYDVTYEAVAGAGIAPANERAVIGSLVAKGAAMTSDIDIDTVVVEGSLTFNGATPPADPTDDGFVVLRHANGDRVLLGNTATGSYSRRVVAGFYDVYYVQDTSSTDAPRNTNARIRELEATDGAFGDIDIPRVDVSGTITLDGAPPPDSDYQDGHLFLRDPESGDSVLLGTTRAGAYSAPVVPGDYEVVYVAQTPGAPLPINTGATIGELSVAAGKPVVVAIDVPALSLAGAVTVNGAAAPMDTLDIGNLYLVDTHTREQMYLGSTYDAAYQQTLTPGEYLVYYRVLTSTGLVPENVDANLGCWSLQ